MAHTPESLASPPTKAPAPPALDPRVLPARLAFGSELAFRGTDILITGYVPEGKQVHVILQQDGRIEQHDTASRITQISHLTVKIEVNGSPFEIDQHAILSTPNHLTQALNLPLNHPKGEVQILRELSAMLQGIDTIAMVHFKYFLNTGIVDTSKGASDPHIGPSFMGYKLSVQLACLRLAVALNAIRFLRHIIKEIEYIWLVSDLNAQQLIAIIEAAPYLNRFLVLWTFGVYAYNFKNKDNLIDWGLRNSAPYRDLILKYSTKNNWKQMMPSLKRFLDNMQQVMTGFPSSQHLAVDPERSTAENADLAMVGMNNSDS